MTTGRPTLHHMDRSQGQRIVWLLEELNVDYELKLHERIRSGPQESRAPEELKKTHQLGKAPQFITADGRVIIESIAIADYILRTYDTEKRFQGDPTTGNDQIRDDILTSFAGTSLGMVMTIEMTFEMVCIKTPGLVRFLPSAIRSMVQKGFTHDEFDKSFKFLETELGQQDYFMGTNPGRADFILSWPFDFCVARKFVDLKKYPALDRWYARCHAREAWKRGIAKSNGYDLSKM